MDSFLKEQQVYDEAVKTLLNAEEGANLDLALYGKLIEEYGKLLKQLKLYRGLEEMSANSSRHMNIEKHDVLNNVHYDVLTGIFNRRYLNENLDRVLNTMANAGDTLSVMMIGIDFFKQFNITYGPNAGDDCLRNVAESLRACLYRGNDFVVRYGDEEFMAVLPYTNEDGAKRVAERMLEQICKLEINHSASQAASCVTVSIGVVSGNRSPLGWMAAEFFSRVDEALAQAKNRGHNQFAYLNLQ